MQNTAVDVHDSDLLLADRVEKYLREEIARRQLQNDLLLPQQQDLADLCHVSLRTIRTVVDRLKADNLIRSIKGKGMFIVPTVKETGSILVVADRLEHPYTSMVIASINNVLLQQGMTPVIARSSDLSRHTDAYRGVLVINGSARLNEFLQQTKLPYCGINDVFDVQLNQSPHHQTVRNNNYLWSFALTEMLLLSGKEKIIFFSSMSETVSGQQKNSGFRDAMRYYGKKYDERDIICVLRDNDPEVDAFCTTTRAYIEEEMRKNPGKVGIGDTSGTMTYPLSMFYHRIIEGAVNAADVAVSEFAESPKAFMTKMMVVTSMEQIIRRALDIILGRCQPFSMCETIENLQIRINEEGIWKHYNYREYIKNTINK